MNYVAFLNRTVFCRLGPSPIHGIGVFAIRDIPKGTEFTDHGIHDINTTVPLYFSEAEFDEILPEIRDLILDRMLFDVSSSRLYCISPNHDQILQSFMNHSDTPNSDGRFALRYIKKGEEVTEDFNTLFTAPHHLTKEKMRGIIK